MSQIASDSQVQLLLAFLRWSCFNRQEKWQRRVAGASKPVASGRLARYPWVVTHLSEGKHWLQTSATLRLYPCMGKVSGVNREVKSGVEVPMAVCCCMQHHCSNSCDIISARRIGLAFPLDYADAVERVRLMNAQSLPHYKPINAQDMTSLYPLII